MQAVTITQITAHELETLIEDSIKRCLTVHKQLPQQQADQWFDLNELCNYLPDKPAKATAYGWVHSSSIPCHKGQGQKKLRFLKSEIDNWLRQGRKKTLAETASEADAYLLKKGGSAL